MCSVGVRGSWILPRIHEGERVLGVTVGDFCCSDSSSVISTRVHHWIWGALKDHGMPSKPLCDP